MCLVQVLPSFPQTITTEPWLGPLTPLPPLNSTPPKLAVKHPSDGLHFSLFYSSLLPPWFFLSITHLSTQLNLSHVRVCVCVCVCVNHSVVYDCNPMDCSPPGSSVHGILYARTLEWVTIPFSRGSSQPRDRTWVSCIAGRFFTIWTTRKAQGISYVTLNMHGFLSVKKGCFV